MKMLSTKKKWYYSESGIAYRERNKEKNRAYQRQWAREWRKKNPAKVKAQNRSAANRIRQARYRARHREEIRKRSLAYNKMKIATDPNARLKWLFRGRINKAIRRNSGKKAFKTMELIGCSVQRAREHIESQFTPEMSWENQGTYWEIDHIIPISSFNLTNLEEQKRCFHYTNLRPLHWLENRKKNNRIMG